MKSLELTNRKLSPISKDRGIMAGIPCIRGTRIPVRNIVDLSRKLKANASEIKRRYYRDLKVEDIEYALRWYSR